MKVLAIRGQNLASLQRPFEVRLDEAPLGATGLFAIVGPVGAGKSTLLDALCLPLFDRTPRLSGRGGATVGDEAQPPGDWLSSNDPRTLLRRGAPQGYAEVDFVGRDGVRYCAQWRVRRARLRPDGRVQDQELQLSDLDRGVVVAQGRKTEVLHEIRTRLGLDFAQFCRSVLLAQGDFAAFLHASAKERAQLLETLTGAEVYRALSKAAHDKRRHFQQERDLLQRQIEGQPALEEAERQALQARARELDREIALHDQAIELAQSYVTWYQAAARHRERESIATTKLQAAALAHQAAGPAREQLARLQRALPLAGPAALLADRGDRLLRLERRGQEIATQIDGAKAKEERARQQLQTVLGQWRSTQAQDGVPLALRELPAWRMQLQQWARLQQRLAQAQAAVVARERDRTECVRRHDLAAHQAKALEPVHATAATELAGARVAVAAAEFEALPGLRRALDAEGPVLQQMQTLCEQWQQASAGRAVAQQRVEAAVAHRAQLAQGLPALVAARTQAEAQLVAARRDMLVASVRRTAAELAEHLHDGEPCPLCGAHEHPAPAVHDPKRGAVVAEAEVQAAADFEQARAAVVDHEKLCVRAESECAQAERQAAQLVLQVQQAVAAWGALAVDSPADDVAAARAVLERQQLRWRERRAEVDALADRMAAARVRLDSATLAERTAADDLRQAQETARELEQSGRQAVLALETATGDVAIASDELASAQATLAPAFAGVSDWQQRLGAGSAQVLAALEHIAAEVCALQALGHEREQLERQARQGLADVAVASEERAQAHADLNRAVATAGVAVADVGAVLKLAPGQLAAEAERLQQLGSAVERQRAIVQQCAEQRREHEQGGRPSIVESDAAAALDDARAARSRVQVERQKMRDELGADDILRRIRAEAQPRLQAAEDTLAIWAALDDLIGSSDGSAFAVFAQTLTLDLLLVEANRRLAELARRYRLHKNATGELDFVVVDLDLGGARRSLQTLSGGETFLVSLALALALATLAAPKSRVETLFLDEGFGTLDAQSLEAALGALDSLQASGCQVGIISHVEGIAERIGAVVEVVPEGGGRSRVLVRSP